MFNDHYGYPELVLVAAAERAREMQRVHAAELARAQRRTQRVRRVRAALRIGGVQ
jgi:hypothetical protein